MRQLLRAHEYWRMKGLAVDLVIVNEQAASYVAGARRGARVARPRRQPAPRRRRGAPGGRGLRAARRAALRRGARRARRGRARRPALAARHARGAGPPAAAARSRRARRARPASRAAAGAGRRLRRASRSSSSTASEASPRTAASTSRSSASGSGRRRPGSTSSPTPRFGCLVSESGSGYTWAVNSRENQLTPWSNDPVSDPPGEALFLRDEETGEIWSPTPLPIRDDGSYVVRHGQGYSRFEHERRGIATDLDHVRCRARTPSRSRVSSVENRSARDAHAHRHRLRRVGARPAAGGRRAVRRHRARRRDGRALRAQLLERGLRRARRVRGPRRRRRPRGRPTAPSSSGATAASTPRRAWRAERSSRGAPGAGLDPCAALQVRAAPGARASARRSSSCSARAATPRRRGGSSPGYRSQDPDRRARRRCAGSGTTRSPRSRSGRPTGRWT